jgi:hypothetical protein
LIKETTMRFTTAAPTTALLLSVSLIACVGEVGGGASGRGHGSGSDGSDDGTCEDVTTPVTIRTVADFDKLPKGCWDLYASLTIQGTEITSLAKLGDLAGVNDLTLVGTKLTTIDSPKPIKVYGPVSISGNATLQNLKNITVERADNIPLDVNVDDNAVLVSLDGVADLVRLDGDLAITSNPKLTAATLHTLTRVDGAVRVTGNAAMTTLDLSHIDTVGRVEVTNNAQLATITGLGAAVIKGDLVLRGNTVLTSLGSMSSLSRIEGSLTIDSNPALTNIAAFTSSMQYITGALTISNNTGLTDLGMVSHLLGIGTISITSNPNLSYCKAREVDACVQSHGSTIIQNNKSASNCGSWCGN